MTFDSTCSDYDPKLSAHIDGELSAAEEIDLSVHLAGCEECRTRLEGFRRVVNRAGGVEDRPLPKDLWAGIAERIGASVPEPEPVAPVKQFGFLREWAPQLLAASLVVITIGAGVGGGWFGQSAPEIVLDTPEIPELVLAPIDTGYERAIADLIRSLEESKAVLDQHTIDAIETNLAVMDQALARANEALAGDPESDFLRRHLARTSRQKLELLQRVTTLTSAD
jgi:hypothetical protein